MFVCLFFNSIKSGNKHGIRMVVFYLQVVYFLDWKSAEMPGIERADGLKLTSTSQFEEPLQKWGRFQIWDKRAPQCEYCSGARW